MAKNKTSSKLLPSTLFGIGFGALFYIVGNVADAVGGGFLTGLTAPIMAVLGFVTAVAIHLTKDL